MKGFIIKREGYEIGGPAKVIVVPQSGTNLVIVCKNKRFKFSLQEKVRIGKNDKTIEVEEKMVRKALAFVKVLEEFADLKKYLNVLFKFNL